MYQTILYHVGDRISTNCMLDGLPAGSCGTVQSVFVSVHGVYEVLFDFASTRRVAYQGDLILIPAVTKVVAI
jgi:hypothetical protein